MIETKVNLSKYQIKMCDAYEKQTTVRIYLSYEKL